MKFQLLSLLHLDPATHSGFFKKDQCIFRCLLLKNRSNFRCYISRMLKITGRWRAMERFICQQHKKKLKKKRTNSVWWSKFGSFLFKTAFNFDSAAFFWRRSSTSSASADSFSVSLKYKMILIEAVKIRSSKFFVQLFSKKKKSILKNPKRSSRFTNLSGSKSASRAALVNQSSVDLIWKN